MVEPIVTSEFHLDNLEDKTARDFLHRAAAEARHGPVWLVNKAGDRIGAIMTPDDVKTLAHLAGPGDGIYAEVAGCPDCNEPSLHRECPAL